MTFNFICDFYYSSNVICEFVLDLEIRVKSADEVAAGGGNGSEVDKG